MQPHSKQKKDDFPWAHNLLATQLITQSHDWDDKTKKKSQDYFLTTGRK